MIAALVQLSPALPAVALATVAALAIGAREGRRRSALNEALHELRRPLQALVLQAPDAARARGGDGPMEMASAALERLDREINGEPAAPELAPLLARPLAESALGRWRERAVGVGATLELHWEAGGAAIDADRQDISAALDNLIDNAIEHGGPRIAVEAASFADTLSLAVVDSGGGEQPRREAPRVSASNDLMTRLSGRRRHGHGLRRVRRTAAAHGGSFSLHKGESGTSAVLELPLLDRGGHR